MLSSNDSGKKMLHMYELVITSCDSNGFIANSKENGSSVNNKNDTFMQLYTEINLCYFIILADEKKITFFNKDLNNLFCVEISCHNQRLIKLLDLSVKFLDWFVDRLFLEFNKIPIVVRVLQVFHFIDLEKGAIVGLAMPGLSMKGVSKRINRCLRILLQYERAWTLEVRGHSMDSRRCILITEHQDC